MMPVVSYQLLAVSYQLSSFVLRRLIADGFA